MAVKPLRDWVKAAGIKKHITLYCFRHTCATMLITAGADINTVSRHMTHASILTTQQYFHLVDEKAREAANMIKLD
jgi:site-specific recombinase XerD